MLHPFSIACCSKLLASWKGYGQTCAGSAWAPCKSAGKLGQQWNRRACLRLTFDRLFLDDETAADAGAQACQCASPCGRLAATSRIVDLAGQHVAVGVKRREPDAVWMEWKRAVGPCLACAQVKPLPPFQKRIARSPGPSRKQTRSTARRRVAACLSRRDCRSAS